MKKLKQRTLFVLLFFAFSSAGLVTFCVFYVLDGAQWASFSANKHVYTEGKIASGAICDGDGTRPVRLRRRNLQHRQNHPGFHAPRCGRPVRQHRYWRKNGLFRSAGWLRLITGTPAPATPSL